METYTLTTPITQLSTISYQVERLDLNWKNSIVHIELRANNGLLIEYNYTGSIAIAQMTLLNKANLTSNSLHKRVITKLMDDGIIPAGSVGGSPD